MPCGDTISNMIEIDYILPLELYQQEINCKDPPPNFIPSCPPQSELIVIVFINKNKKVCNFFHRDAF